MQDPPLVCIRRATSFGGSVQVDARTQEDAKIANTGVGAHTTLSTLEPAHAHKIENLLDSTASINQGLCGAEPDYGQ
jgi:hypothetical protein